MEEGSGQKAVRLMALALLLTANVASIAALYTGSDRLWQWIIYLLTLGILPFLFASKSKSRDSSPPMLCLPAHSASLHSRELSPRLEALFAFLLFMLAIFLRLFRYAQVPPGIWTDELLASANAVRIMEGTPAPLFGTLPLIPGRPGWVHTFNLYTYTVVGIFKVFGVHLLSIKLISILPGCITVVGFYWMLRELGGSRLALPGTFLLSASRWHLVQSRYEWDATLTVALSVLGLAAMLRTLRTGRAEFMVLGGLLIGVSQAAYLSSRTVAAGTFLWLLLLVLGGWRGRPQFRLEALKWGVLWSLAFTLAASPVLVHTLKHPEIARARVTELQLDKAKGAKRTSVAENVGVYLKMFGIEGPRHARQNIPKRPLMPAPYALLLGIGAIVSLVRWRLPGHSMVLALMAGTLAAGIFSRSDGTPNAHRVGLAAPLAYLLVALTLNFVAHALGQLIARVRARTPHQPRLSAGLVLTLRVLLAVLLLLPSGKDAFDYFVTFGQSTALFRAIPEARHAVLARLMEPHLKNGEEELRVAAAFDGLTLRLLTWRAPTEEGGVPHGGLADPPMAFTPLSPRRLLEPTEKTRLLLALAPDQVAAFKPLYPRLKATRGRSPSGSTVAALVTLRPDDLEEAREALKRRAIALQGDFFLLPEDLEGKGMVRAMHGLQNEASEWRELFVDRPKRLEALPSEPLSRHDQVARWYATLEIEEEGDYLIEDPKRRRQTILWLDGVATPLWLKPHPVHLTAGAHSFVLEAKVSAYRKVTLRWTRPGAKQSEPIPGDRLHPVVPPEFEQAKMRIEVSKAPPSREEEEPTPDE